MLIETSTVNEFIILLGVLFMGTMTFFTAKLTQKVKKNGSSLEDLHQVNVSIHTLVNGNMAAALHKTKNLARRIADLTHDPKDITAAIEALQLYEQHMTKQALLDKRAMQELQIKSSLDSSTLK